MPMKINIIRGQNQIGGNIVEISTDKTKIILDGAQCTVVEYTNWVSWGLSIIVCTILVILICETFDLVFVATISTIVPLGGYLVHLIKKNYSNDKTQQSSKSNNKVNDAKKKKPNKTKPRKS